MVPEPGKGAQKTAPAAPIAKVGGVSTPLMKGRVAEVGSASLRPVIYKQLTLLAMIPTLQAFAKLRKPGYLERSEVPVPEPVQKRWARSPVKGESFFQPKLNVLDDESLLLDCPLEGGNLGYWLLKGLQLKYDLPVDKVKAATAVHAHNLAVVSVPLACFNTSFISAFDVLLMNVRSPQVNSYKQRLLFTG